MQEQGLMTEQMKHDYVFQTQNMVVAPVEVKEFKLFPENDSCEGRDYHHTTERGVELNYGGWRDFRVSMGARVPRLYWENGKNVSGRPIVYVYTMYDVPENETRELMNPQSGQWQEFHFTGDYNCVPVVWSLFHFLRDTFPRFMNLSYDSFLQTTMNKNGTNVGAYLNVSPMALPLLLEMIAYNEPFGF